jgi:hypothetical protein
VTVGALLSPLLTSMPATASPGSSCEQKVTDNVEGYDAAQPGTQIAVGIRSYLWYGKWNSLNNGGDCARVSSIAALAGGDAQVEWGWVLGWSSDGGAYTGSDACDRSYHTAPYVFVVWWPIGGEYHCRGVLISADSQYFWMTIKDTDQNKVWYYYRSGTQLGSVTVNFNNGTLATNGERHNNSIDTAFAHFQSLEKQVSGIGTWFDFADSELLFDNDPGFHWIKVSDTETKVDVG